MLGRERYDGSQSQGREEWHLWAISNLANDSGQWPLMSVDGDGRVGDRMDELTSTAVGDAERYTPGSTMENLVGTCMNDEEGCFEAMAPGGAER